MDLKLSNFFSRTNRNGMVIMASIVVFFLGDMTPVYSFMATPTNTIKQSAFLSKIHGDRTITSTSSSSLKMSFIADGSDYSSSDSDFESGEEDSDMDSDDTMYNPLAIDAPTVEEEPVPLSKNAGSRFVAFVWDQKVASNMDRTELHDHRTRLITDHVMYCRKANLYNETFNYNSMVDIPFSYPLLSSDLGSFIGHAMCLDSNELEYAQDFLSKEPTIQSLTGGSGDLSNIAIYRWRHIKDHTLRQDSGRFGKPTMLISLHHGEKEDEPALSKKEKDELLTTRAKHYRDHLEYLIRSERVIMAGPLHVCTKEKNDKNSLPVGDLIIFNSGSREEAIEFAENDPLALNAGLYGTMRIHNFNDLDVTGKFVSEDRFQDPDHKSLHMEMQEALNFWGYPVEDTQTKWLNM